jgi:hypothetical protein
LRVNFVGYPGFTIHVHEVVILLIFWVAVH